LRELRRVELEAIQRQAELEKRQEEERARALAEKEAVRQAERQKLRKAWSQIVQGVSVENVYSLLGQPDSTFSWPGLGTTLTYGFGQITVKNGFVSDYRKPTLLDVDY